VLAIAGRDSEKPTHCEDTGQICIQGHIIGFAETVVTAIGPVKFVRRKDKVSVDRSISKCHLSLGQLSVTFARRMATIRQLFLERSLEKLFYFWPNVSDTIWLTSLMDEGISMKAFNAVRFGLPVVLALVMMGCARDRMACSGCSSTPNTISQNAAEYSPNPNSRVGTNSGSSGANVVQHKLCPVTNEPLDSMGGAIPVSANGREIFVCCQGCVKPVKNDPDKYLAIALAE